MSRSITGTKNEHMSNKNIFLTRKQNSLQWWPPNNILLSSFKHVPQKEHDVMNLNGAHCIDHLKNMKTQ